MRDELHRWALLATVALTLLASAIRRSRARRNRRRMWREIEARWW